MKKTNKGFSMVELIIVIAIMAILAGALAPALIKYINKSRISTDIQTANTIATAIQTALSNENGYDDASSYEATAPSTFANIWNGTPGSSFVDAVQQPVGGSKCPTGKSKKCVGKGDAAATFDTDKNFKYVLERTNNKVEIYDNSGTHMLYPTASACLTDDTVTHAASKVGASANNGGNQQTP